MFNLKKSLLKLTSKEQKLVSSLLKRIIDKDFEGLNITKLKETNDVFRVRKGQLRIIFRWKQDNIEIFAIERRSEKTYRKY